MIALSLALALIVTLMLGYLWLIQASVDPDSLLCRTRRRLHETRQARLDVADLDREYASLVDEHRPTP